MDVNMLILPFQFAFMQNAFLISIIVSVPTALLSCFLVMKGWALMGDAVSHAILPGIVVASILGIPLLIGAFAAGMTCALATGYLASNSRVKQDTVMGVVFSGMFGLGIVLYVGVETGAHLDHILSTDADADIAAFRLAEMLRDAGIDIDFPTTGSIGKKLKKAARADIKLAIILGGDELAKNNVQLRNLADGTQSEVMMDDLADVVAAALLAP